MLSAIIQKPGDTDNVISKGVTGETVSEIEAQAEEFGAVRIQFSHGAIWRKFAGQWIVIK